jgi:hypothetical protein
MWLGRWLVCRFPRSTTPRSRPEGGGCPVPGPHPRSSVAAFGDSGSDGWSKAREVVRKGALKHRELNRKAEEGSEARQCVRTTARSSPAVARANTRARQDGGGARGRAAPWDIRTLHPRFLTYAVYIRHHQRWGSVCFQRSARPRIA